MSSPVIPQSMMCYVFSVTDQQELDRLIRALSAVLTPKQIAARYHVSTKTIQRYYRRLGIPLPQKHQQENAVSRWVVMGECLLTRPEVMALFHVPQRACYHDFQRALFRGAAHVGLQPEHPEI